MDNVLESTRKLQKGWTHQRTSGLSTPCTVRVDSEMFHCRALMSRCQVHQQF